MRIRRNRENEAVAVGRTRYNRENQADTSSCSRENQSVAVGRLRQAQAVAVGKIRQAQAGNYTKDKICRLNKVVKGRNVNSCIKGGQHRCKYTGC